MALRRRRWVIVSTVGLGLLIAALIAAAGRVPFSSDRLRQKAATTVGDRLDANVELGTEVKLVWGEEGGGTKKPTVERHKQIEIRAKVSPAPYSKMAQTTYHEGWRSKATV